MLDSIIVGYGLAGFHYAWQLKQQKKDYLLITNQSMGSSRKAAGICNPTVLKRYTMAWEGENFLEYAIKHYKECGLQLSTNFFHSIPIHRYFFQAAEQNDWIVAAQKKGLSSFLDPLPSHLINSNLKRKEGFGIVNSVGRLDINTLLDIFQKHTIPSSFMEEEFEYESLKILKNKVVYKGIEAKNIVFCEGYRLKTNPWFQYLPLVGSKGESFEIIAPQLSRTQIIKGSLFIAPIKQDFFWVGASFSSKDKETIPTPSGKEWLISRLDNLLNVPYEIRAHHAAIRPTVIDRRPLIGQHPKYPNLFVFNGLGTRGVLMAPLLSKWLYEFIEEGKQIPNEVAIHRFESYFCNPNRKHV